MLNRAKAAGRGAIIAEMIKMIDKRGLEEKVGILPIYKKGDSRECSNYREISLLRIMLKIYERILDKQQKIIIE